MMSRKEYMYWQNRKYRVSEVHLCASERSERAIFGVFNSFTVKKVSFFTINVKSYLQKVGGGGCLYRPSPHPKKWGGGGIHPPPPSPGIYASGLRKLWFLFDKFGIILSSLFRTIPTYCALHHSSQSSHYHVKGRTFFNIAWSAHKISISGHDMDWWTVGLESGWGVAIPVSMLLLWKRFLVGTFRAQTYPQLSHAFLLAFENILHKITQCLVNYCRFAQWWWQGDTAWK